MDDRPVESEGPSTGTDDVGPAVATPSRRRRRRPEALLLPIVWLVLGLVGGIGIVNWVRADDPAPTAAAAQSPSPKKSTKPAAKKSTKTASPKTEPSSEPTTDPTTEPTEAVATRSIPVIVYNQIGIGGLAARVSGLAQSAGWVVADTGNWRGSVPQDTVYYPPGQQAEAAQLGSDLGIARLMPAVTNMSGSHLTVVLASPR